MVGEAWVWNFAKQQHVLAVIWENAPLDAEEYLNGAVSAETFRRFGVRIRVYIGEPHQEEPEDGQA